MKSLVSSCRKWAIAWRKKVSKSLSSKTYPLPRIPESVANFPRDLCFRICVFLAFFRAAFEAFLVCLEVLELGLDDYFEDFEVERFFGDLDRDLVKISEG